MDAALDTEQPGMVAIEVFDAESMTDASDPLLSHPQLIATPYIGFVTEDDLDMQFADIFDQVNAFAGGAPINMINPRVWTGSRESGG